MNTDNILEIIAGSIVVAIVIAATVIFYKIDKKGRK